MSAARQLASKKAQSDGFSDQNLKKRIQRKRNPGDPSWKTSKEVYPKPGTARQTASTRIPGGITNPSTKLNVYYRENGKDRFVGTAGRDTTGVGLRAQMYGQQDGTRYDKVTYIPGGRFYSSNSRKP